MATYYAAQLGIALSIVDSNENHEVNFRVIQHNDIVDVLIKVHSQIVLLSKNVDVNVLNKNK